MHEKYVAIIQAGGNGTRMFSLTHDLIPKPMLILNGKPMLQWQMENLSQYGINEFVIIIGHLGEKIKEYFGNGAHFGYDIKYIEEDTPLGSAGALYYLKSIYSDKNYIVIFGDVMFCIDWDRMISFHEKKCGIATLLAHPNSHPYDSDILVLNEDDEVIGINSKNSKRDYWYSNCVNAGIYILNADLINRIQQPIKLDLEKDLIAPNIGEKRIYGYVTPEYVKDAGTPDRFEIVAKEQINGVWNRKCLKNKQACVFLDRDGTINKFKGLINNDKQLELEQNAAKAIRMLNESGFLAVIVTNQPVIARGMCKIEDVELIHKKLMTLLGEEGAYVDSIVYCPHHPDKGYPEENPEYKIPCTCRKPQIGMIEKIRARYNVDLSKSFMIGDSTVDIQTGINAGIKTVLVKTGQAGKDLKYDVKSDYIANDILDAVKIIISKDKVL